MLRGAKKKVVDLFIEFPFSINLIDKKIQDLRLHMPVENNISYNWNPYPASIELSVNRFGYFSKYVEHSDINNCWYYDVHYTRIFKDDDYVTVKLEELSKEEANFIVGIIIPYLYTEGKYNTEVPLLVNVFPEFVSLISMSEPEREIFPDDDSDNDHDPD